MGGATNDRAARDFLATLRVGDLCSGTAAEVDGVRGVAVTLDGFPARPLGAVGPLDLSRRRYPAEAVQAGRRITAQVTAVDLNEGRVQLSMAAAENPELWAFLEPLWRGAILSGRVAAIERFGVFVALDEGPAHPVFPGVGFITYPELSWRRFEAATDVVRVGRRVTCEFLQFDTWNGEARLSLRAMQPDPFQAFADGVQAGQILHGQVTTLAPFGAFVQVADGVEGLVRLRELAAHPVRSPAEAVRAGDAVSVAVIDVDRQRRRLLLSRRLALPESG
ncbi:S1 RNA-binding domain-containing protein [Kitasatospora sp. NPDC057223]|uniref:S1 RNA-binding domain-containing protein n=1 Tax=Kitasatospora sp. NPDC057223 TaxID=3346055 RepID=UPI003634207E